LISDSGIADDVISQMGFPLFGNQPYFELSDRNTAVRTVAMRIATLACPKLEDVLFTV
jgi:hypothetical protein